MWLPKRKMILCTASGSDQDRSQRWYTETDSGHIAERILQLGTCVKHKVDKAQQEQHQQEMKNCYQNRMVKRLLKIHPLSLNLILHYAEAAEPSDLQLVMTHQVKEGRV